MGTNVLQFRRVLATLAILMLIGVVVLLSRSGKEAESRANLGSQLQCGQGEPIAITHRDYPSNPTSGMPSAEAAMKVFLANEMPKLAFSSLELRPGSTAQYMFRQNGRVVAHFDLAMIGEGWRFAGFSACDSFVVENLVVPE